MKIGKKGDAIWYIIAVILGVAVILVLGYWFFNLGGKIGGKTAVAECEAKQITYCQSWKNLGCGALKPIEIDWKNCEDEQPPDTSECETLLGSWCT